MTSPDPAAILTQINSARDQTYQNIALAQGILTQANQAAAAAAQDRAAIQAIAQQTVSVNTSVGTRVFAGDTLIYGDTGWRDISGLRNSEIFAGGVLTIRRVSNVVEVAFSGFRRNGDTSGDVAELCILPAGFRPNGTSRYGTTYWGNRWIIGSNGRVQASPITGGDYLTVSYTTLNPWPTSLPGTPA